jgi:hypothetical protein
MKGDKFMAYTKEQLDNLIIKVTDALEGTLPNNVKLSGPILDGNVKLKDLYADKEIYGFYGKYTNTDLFWISFRVPSCMEKVENIQNIYVELEMNKKSNTDILTNHDKRNDFIKFLYNQHEPEFIEDNITGIWKYTSHRAWNSSVRIYKEFKVKNTGLPSVDDVVKSFKILANLDIPSELKKWCELHK